MACKFKHLFIIPNAIPPYGFEFVNILCLPKGTKSRFRFKEKWVNDEFKANHKLYIGETIHILLRDKTNTTIFPLRKAKVDQISRIGETYYIRYTLLDYFEYDSKDTVRNDQLREYREGFYRYHTDIKDNHPDMDMRPLVFGSNYQFNFVNQHFDTDEPVMKEFEVFENIISTIKDITFFKSVTFTKIISLEYVNSKGHITVSDGKYQIKEESDYILKLYQTTPTLDLDCVQIPNDIELKSDAKYITVIKGKQRAVGKYDVIEMMFRTNMNTAGANTSLDICYKLKPGAEQYIDPNINLPLHINHRHRSILIRILVLIVAILIYLYSYMIKMLKDVPLDYVKHITVITVAIVIFDLKNKLIDYFKRQ